MRRYLAPKHGVGLGIELPSDRFHIVQDAVTEEPEGEGRENRRRGEDMPEKAVRDALGEALAVFVRQLREALPDPRSLLTIVGCDHAAEERIDVLRTSAAEEAHRADRAGSAAAMAGTECLARVLQERHPVPRADRLDFVQPGHEPVQMRHHNGAGPMVDEALNAGRRQVAGILIDVGEERNSPAAITMLTTS